jgi:hypothetical protein
MKQQTNGAVMWLVSLLIAIPLFIALAGVNFAMALIERISAATNPVNLV